MREGAKRYPLKPLCKLLGVTRQAFYKHQPTEADFAKDAMEQVIVDKVREKRKTCPRLGCLKLYELLKAILGNCSGFPGRDSFFQLLRANHLLVQIKRRRHYRTTDSNHELRKYPNLIKGMKLTRPNEVWVCDITYIETLEGVCYLSLVTDMYSHKILGWALGPTLETKYCLEALRMALKTLPEGFDQKLIHHSDRGCQYCSYEYVRTLRAQGIGISMTESGDPLENAVAERVNGILKDEWIYRMKIGGRESCKDKLMEIIRAYNEDRPHMSIGMKTPSTAHGETGEQKRCWANPWERLKTANSTGQETAAEANA